MRVRASPIFQVLPVTFTSLHQLLLLLLLLLSNSGERGSNHACGQFFSPGPAWAGLSLMLCHGVPTHAAMQVGCNPSFSHLLPRVVYSHRVVPWRLVGW